MQGQCQSVTSGVYEVYMDQIYCADIGRIYCGNVVDLVNVFLLKLYVGDIDEYVFWMHGCITSIIRLFVTTLYNGI